MPNKSNTLNILYFGDIIGKLGRQALAKIIPEYKKEISPDFIIANVENLAHGKSLTKNTWQEIQDAGLNFGTSGNHVFKKPEGVEILATESSQVIRPANYPTDTPGAGYKIVKIKDQEVLIINLLGRVFIQGQQEERILDNPFEVVQKILDNNKNIKNVIVDFHAEATSEKNAMGLMLDGKVSAVLGTHTHVPTADCRVLPQGTGYVTDLGMVGAHNSILGGEPEALISGFQKGLDKVMFEIPKNGLCIINAVVIKIDAKTGQCAQIYRLDKEIEI